MQTIAERIRSKLNTLTRTERRLADAILKDYPLSGLGGVAAIAKAAGVSLPTVPRLEKKIGINGHQGMQAGIRSELHSMLATPIAKRNQWTKDASETHILNVFADAVMENMRRSLQLISTRQFNKTAALLADKTRAVHIAGGRLTRPLADYFFTHLQIVRGRVTLLPSGAQAWPHYILNIAKKDVVVIFDIRRYQQDALGLAEKAANQGGIVVLFTDQWGSPVAKHATHSFYARIEAPSAWDSSAVHMLIIESLVSAAANASWNESRKRIKALENLYPRGEISPNPDAAKAQAKAEQKNRRRAGQKNARKRVNS